MGANSKSQTADTLISPQEILHSSRKNMWEGIACGNISQYNRKTIHQRYIVNMFVSGFPRSYWIWSCLSPSEKESPKHIVKGVCSLLVCGSWERVLPLAANLIFHNMFVDIPWSALKYRQHMEERWEGCFCLNAHTERATQNLRRRSCSRTGEPGWGPLIVPLPPSLLTASSFFLVLVHSSPSAGRRGVVAAEVMNALATRWRRNNERNVNSHWTDPLIQISILGPCGCCGEISSNIVCFPPDALITCSKAFAEARS